MGKTGLTCCFLLLAGCSGTSQEDPGNTSLAGQWCGAQVASAEACVGDEIHFVEIVESGGQLSGQSCEAYEKECYPLLDATVEGRHLSYGYEFSGYRVDADLTLSRDGKQLGGTFFSTKCGCEVPVTLHRL